MRDDTEQESLTPPTGGAVGREDLITMVERLQAEARSERQAQQQVRARLEEAVRQSAENMHRLRDESHAERRALREEVARFKLEVDERLRAASEDRLRSQRIVEALPVAIAYLDRDLVCRWANEAFARMSGRAKSEVVGRPILDIFPEAPPGLAGLLQGCFTPGVRGEPLKLPFVQAVPGCPAARHWDVLALPLLAENAQVDGILLAFDVTEQVEGQQVQAARIAQLTELDRLKGDFIGMVSHELRTPLSAIAGYAEFLEDDTGGPLTAAQRSYVQAIQVAEARIRQMVDDLLDFARVEAGTFQLEVQSVDLVEATHQALALLVPAGQSGRVQLILSQAPIHLCVLADPERLQQVLLNVIGNGIKFTPPGGSVEVTLGQRGDVALVRVRDTGIGIPPDCLPKVFDRFYQVDSTSTRMRGGVGLGLALAKSLVERQGGQMGVESEVGQGTSFWFTLPLCEAGVAA